MAKRKVGVGRMGEGGGGGGLTETVKEAVKVLTRRGNRKNDHLCMARQLLVRLPQCLQASMSRYGSEADAAYSAMRKTLSRPAIGAGGKAQHAPVCAREASDLDNTTPFAAVYPLPVRAGCACECCLPRPSWRGMWRNWPRAVGAQTPLPVLTTPLPTLTIPPPPC